jgi:hypothetical protein
VEGDERQLAIASFRAQRGGWVRGLLLKGIFEQLPDPADHPTFRIEPADATRQTKALKSRLRELTADPVPALDETG